MATTKRTKSASEISEGQARSLVKNYRYDQNRLNTKSMYHQFFDLQPYRKVIKRYTKTDMAPITFHRQSPEDSRAPIEGLLITTEKEGWFPFVAHGYADIEQGTLCQINLWDYNSDVIELYEGLDDIDIFERMNRELLAAERLVECKEGIVYAYDNLYGDLNVNGSVGEAPKITARIGR